MKFLYFEAYAGGVSPGRFNFILNLPCGPRPGDSVDGLPSFDGKESGVPPPARGGTAGTVLSGTALHLDSFNRALIQCIG